MDKDTVLKIEGLGKKYIISHQDNEKRNSSHYVALRDVLAKKAQNFAKNVLKPHKWFSRSEKEEFWALKDINLEVKRGDKVAIIGHNGAGKSTLLKILSRITEPTEGEIKICGRVTSLLEVGTGFHPELTGRENIYLNGSILGMSHAEIDQKFDEIVAFAGVEKFLDIPVKRYSSGMRMRLGFAVAAHLDSEVLIIDEILAVGDAEFQKKCLGKMDEISKTDERTIIFVSHNMGAVQQLCNKAYLLQNGQVKESGKTSSIIKNYFTSLLKSHTIIRQKDASVTFLPHKKVESHVLGEDIDFHITIEADEDISDISFDFAIINAKNIRCITYQSEAFHSSLRLRKGISNFSITIKNPYLSIGNYYIKLHIHKNQKANTILLIEECNHFDVTFPDKNNNSKSQKSGGVITPDIQFNYNSDNAARE